MTVVRRVSLVGRVLAAAIVLATTAVQPADAQTETVEYYGMDAVGSTRIVFSPSGVVLGRQDYGPFGTRLVTATGLPPELFGGNTADPESNQAYFHARQYEARIGRLTTPDPILDGTLQPQRWNRYTYAVNNPITFVDPAGLNAQPTDSCEWTTVTLDSGEDFTFCNVTVRPGDGGGGTGGGGWSSLIQDVLNAMSWAGMHIGETVLGGSVAVGGDELVPTGGTGYHPPPLLETATDAAMVVVATTIIGKSIVSKVAGRVAAGAATDAAVLENANFAQRTFSRAFSAEGKFASRTVEDVATALRSGEMSVGDVPIEYIIRDGNPLILNTRSAQALQQAGIPRSAWNAINVTGDPAAEVRLTQQLVGNGLTSRGTPTVSVGR